MARLRLIRVYQSDPLAPIHIELAAANDPEGGPGLGDIATAEPGPDSAAIAGGEQPQGRAAGLDAPMSDTNGGPAEAG